MTAWLLTWVWQGMALALGVSLALRCVRRLNAATRHIIWFASLAALAWLGWAGSPHGIPSPGPVQTPIADPIYIPSAPDILISGVIGIWVAFALVALLRLLPGLHAVYALRDRCAPFPSAIEATLPLWLEAKASGRRTDLMLCDAVPGATVLGLQRPCIAIPSSLVEALTAEELDQVILHEHAHVLRRDDWSRLTQALLMSVLWIHPAALVISRALNRERELACDECVVARTGSPKALARCLTRVAEVRIGGRLSALVPALFTNRHELVRRVDYLLMIKGRTRSHVSFVRATAALFAIAVVSVQLHGIRFAEIADVVLPHVARPDLVAYNEMREVAEELPAAIESIGSRAFVAVSGRIEPVAFNALVAPNALDAPGSVPDAPGAPAAPDAPSSPVESAPLTPRILISGVYPSPRAPAVRSLDQPNPWSALGTPGVEIASAAKKTSVGIASVFSRAGISLARSF